MKLQENIFSNWHKVSSLLMMLLLAWLTISTPYVYASQKSHQQVSQCCADCEEDYNPFSQTTEEKTQSGVNQLSEFLHNLTLVEFHYISVPNFYKCHADEDYIAYHPDLLVPPPKA